MSNAPTVIEVEAEYDRMIDTFSATVIAEGECPAEYFHETYVLLSKQDSSLYEQGWNDAMEHIRKSMWNK